MTEAPEPLQRMVRLGARALSRGGLVTAFGHCSVRVDKARLLVCSARPMGQIAVGEAGVVAPLDGDLPDGVLGEVRLHQAIYRACPSAGAVCRIFPPFIVALSSLGITPRPCSAAGIPFAPQPPLWNDARLIRDPEAARAVAEAMGAAPAIVLKTNGAVVVGRDMPEAVTLSALLEEAARIEHLTRLHAPSGAEVLSDAEIQGRRAAAAAARDLRLWSYLTADDPEA